jgi:hypothetical protein
VKEMKNVRNHAKLRYCERVLDMSDANEIKQYLAKNDQQVIEHVNRLAEHSNLIYRGQIGDNTTKIFRMVDNMIVVFDAQDTCVITLFKCIFDFGESMDRIIIKSELEQIEDLHNHLRIEDETINAFIEKRTVDSSTIDIQIKTFEEQLKLLKQQKVGIDEEVKGRKAGREIIVKEIEKKAVRLCNSLEYRRDLQTAQ